MGKISIQLDKIFTQKKHLFIVEGVKTELRASHWIK